MKLTAYLDTDTATPLILENNLLQIELTYIGEGDHGDYNPNDPNDEPLIRFYARANKNFGANNDPEWEDIEDASRCTRMPITTPPEDLFKAALTMFNKFRQVVTGYPVQLSVRNITNELSWL